MKNNDHKITPFGHFTFDVDIIDKRHNQVVKESYVLCRKMGFVNLYNLFHDGCAIKFILELEQITGIKLNKLSWL